MMTQKVRLPSTQLMILKLMAAVWWLKKRVLVKKALVVHLSAVTVVVAVAVSIVAVTVVAAVADLIAVAIVVVEVVSTVAEIAVVEVTVDSTAADTTKHPLTPHTKGAPLGAFFLRPSHCNLNQYPLDD